MTRQQGAALMLVMWLLLLLTALVGSFAFSARIESMLGRGLARSVAASEAARAGIEMAVLRLHAADPAQRWQADGRPYQWAFGGSRVSVHLLDEAGKLDLNSADVSLLAALIRETGVSATRAEALAAAIVDWRDEDELITPQGAERAQYLAAGLPYGPRNAPFEHLAELQLVLGMDEEMYMRLRHNLTLHSNRSLPDPRLAPPQVLAALGIDVGTALSLRDEPVSFDDLARRAGGSRVVMVMALAQLDDGRESRLHALLRIPANADAGTAYTVLEWNEDVLQ